MNPDHHDHPWVWSWEVFGVIPALHDLPRDWSWEDLNRLGSHGLLRFGPLTSPELARGCCVFPVPLTPLRPDLQTSRRSCWTSWVVMEIPLSGSTGPPGRSCWTFREILETLSGALGFGRHKSGIRASRLQDVT